MDILLHKDIASLFLKDNGSLLTSIEEPLTSIGLSQCKNTGQSFFKLFKYSSHWEKCFFKNCSMKGSYGFYFYGVSVKTHL